MLRVRAIVLPVLFTSGFTVIKLLVPPLGIQLPFILYFGAVLLSVLYGGRVAGIVASLLSGATANLLFLPPSGVFSLAPAAILQTSTFLFEAFTLVVLVDLAQTANERLDTMQRFTAGLSSAVRPEDVARLVVDEGTAMLGATTAALVRSKDAATLEVLASHGVSQAVLDKVREVPVDGANPASTAFRTGQEEWIESREEYERCYPAFAKATLTDDASAGAIGLPLVARDRTIGAVSFRFSQSKFFGSRMRSLVAVLAEQAAQALDRAMLHASEIEKRQRLEALTLLADDLATTLDWDGVAQVVVERGRTAAGADTCTFFELLPSDGSLVLRAERGCRPGVVERIRVVPAGSPNPSQKALRGRASVWVESEEEYKAQFPALASLAIEGARARAFWCVPLIAAGRPIALLGMGYYEERRFPPETRAFIEAFCNQCAQALDRARRVEGERKALAATEEARTWLETTLRSIGDAVIATDMQGRITTINRVACELTGWSEGDALGRPLGEVFRVVHEQTRAEIESPVDKVLRERSGGGALESHDPPRKGRRDGDADRRQRRAHPRRPGRDPRRRPGLSERERRQADRDATRLPCRRVGGVCLVARLSSNALPGRRARRAPTRGLVLDRGGRRRRREAARRGALRPREGRSGARARAALPDEPGRPAGLAERDPDGQERVLPGDLRRAARARRDRRRAPSHLA